MKTPHVFGIRHLSPGGAYHLRRFLNEIKPTAVLIEGPSDANDKIKYLTSPAVKPPIALLAYTEELPIETILYPFAEYSPEYQALLWAEENNAYSEFIDLPTEVFLAFDRARDINNEQGEHVSIYDRWASSAGEKDHEVYWERFFEHNLNKDNYRLAVYEYSKSIRELSEQQDRLFNTKEYAVNLIREAFMRRNINKAIENGHSPDKIVIVTGAYHASALLYSENDMSEEEFKKLNRKSCKITLMPYSYYKLSSQSGYGAGNNAPAYFEMMWKCMNERDLDRLPAYYLSQVTSHLRNSGTVRSSAEVIESVRLATALASLNGGSFPVLNDLKDAAITCLGHGELSVVAEAFARTEVGTSIGFLPEGVSQTPVQENFYRELKRLKLDKYRTAVLKDLDLDLRENRRVKSEEAAFLDLNRSFFLHRLRVLNISFGGFKGNSSQSGTWGESWALKWSPQAEIEMVEANLMGETIELATAFKFKDTLEKCQKISDAAKVINDACKCGMTESMETARVILQGLAVEAGDFLEIADTVRELAVIISYGDIRRFDSSHFIPLMQQLFLRGALLMMDACNCNDEASNKVLQGINDMNIVASEQFENIDEGIWLQVLRELSERDDRNPRLSGYAAAILLEKNLLSNEELSTEVSRRLSPGIEADLGAGWFEGLSMKNRYALLSRIALWQQLAEYVASLDKEQFQRALVFLRRAFGCFEASEKNRIAEILGEIWEVSVEDTSEYLNSDLEAEEEILDDLNDFDFGDI